MISENVSTKSDLGKIDSEMKAGFSKLRSEMKELRLEMDRKIAKMETSIVIKISMIMGVQLTILGAVSKFFF